MDNYISRLDEIDKWLFDSFGILPGACSSTENLRHTTARMVAEALWPKKDPSLTWEDVAILITIYEQEVEAGIISRYEDEGVPSLQEASEIILRRFNEIRKK